MTSFNEFMVIVHRDPFLGTFSGSLYPRKQSAGVSDRRLVLFRISVHYDRDDTGPRCTGSFSQDFYRFSV